MRHFAAPDFRDGSLNLASVSKTKRQVFERAEDRV